MATSRRSLKTIKYYAASISDEDEDIRKKSIDKDSKKFLKNQIETSRNENDNLNKELDKKDKTIADLNSKIESLNDIINENHAENLGKGSNIASSKIIDLCKKNRQLTAELESFKTKYQQSVANISKLEEENNKQKISNKQSEETLKPKQSISQNDLESLTEKLSVTKTKLFDALNQNNQLKNDLKLAQKCIQQEIGENVNLSMLVGSNSSNFRGRSQQIMSLQNKISELKEKIEKSNIDVEPEKQLRKIESQHKIEQEQNKKEINNLKEIIENQKYKMNALKIRNKNLNDEATSYKLKTLDLLEKSQNDDKYIQTLNEQISILKFQHESKLAELAEKMKNLDKIKYDMEIENSKTLIKLENSQYLIKDKQKLNDDLNEQVKFLENNLKNICGDFLFSCQDLSKDQFLAILNGLEGEKTSLLQQISTLNDRVESERSKLINIQDQLGKQRVRNTRLEARLKEFEDEKSALKSRDKRKERIREFTTRSLSVTSINDSSTTITNKNDSLNIQLDDLKNKLEFSKERINFLQQKINEINQEKNIDTKLLQEIITKSKNLMVNSMKGENISLQIKIE